MSIFDQDFINIVEKIVQDHGKQAILELNEWRAPLMDGIGSRYRKESRLLLRAVESGAAKAILAARDLDLCKKQEVHILVDDYSTSAEAAAGVMDLLGLVLRGDKTHLEVPRLVDPQVVLLDPQVVQENVELSMNLQQQMYEKAELVKQLDKTVNEKQAIASSLKSTKELLVRAEEAKTLALNEKASVEKKLLDHTFCPYCGKKIIIN